MNKVKSFFLSPLFKNLHKRPSVNLAAFFGLLHLLFFILASWIYINAAINNDVEAGGSSIFLFIIPCLMVDNVSRVLFPLFIIETILLKLNFKCSIEPPKPLNKLFAFCKNLLEKKWYQKLILILSIYYLIALVYSSIMFTWALISNNFDTREYRNTGI